ncbi:MAG: glycosyltransferase [Bacteroidota bacterium]
MKNNFKISVVIATYNRSELLLELLKSLQHQSLKADTYEVIVVCDGCTDDTLEKLKSQEKEMPSLKWLALPKGNPAKARNAAIEIAKAPIIALTDDDCKVSYSWLKTILEVFEEEDIVGLQGKTITDNALISPLTHQIENLEGHPAVPTCNAAFKTAILRKIGGFDDSFPFAHNEDADLAWRIRSEGVVKFIPDMIVSHPPRKVPFTKMLDRMKILESEFMLFHKDPELYKFWRNDSPWQTIYREVFLKHQLLLFKSRLRYFKKPILMIKGIIISLVWWIDLLIKYPFFIKVDAYYKEKYQRKLSSSKENRLAA